MEGDSHQAQGKRATDQGKQRDEAIDYRALHGQARKLSKVNP